VASTSTEKVMYHAAIAWTVILLAIIVGGFVAPALLAGPDVLGSQLLARSLMEIWLLVGLVAWSLHRVDVRGLLTITQRAVAIVLLAGLLVSQFTFGRLGGYPFRPWGMYTAPQDRVAYAELVMLDGEDEVGRLPVSTLAPTTSSRGFLSRIEEMLRQAEDGDQEAVDALTLTISRLLAAHGDPAVDAVDLRWCEVTGVGPQLGTACLTAMVVHR
jgi:hypothetical protein